MQFWSEIILVISNETRSARSFDFEITRMISGQTALHSVQLITIMSRNKLKFVGKDWINLCYQKIGFFSMKQRKKKSTIMFSRINSFMEELLKVEYE